MLVNKCIHYVCIIMIVTHLRNNVGTHHADSIEAGLRHKVMQRKKRLHHAVTDLFLWLFFFHLLLAGSHTGLCVCLANTEILQFIMSQTLNRFPVHWIAYVTVLCMDFVSFTEMQICSETPQNFFFLFKAVFVSLFSAEYILMAMGAQ